MLWLLPALTVLWTNLHGGFIAGLILIAAYTAGGLMEALLEPAADIRRAHPGASQAVLLSAAFCARWRPW